MTLPTTLGEMPSSSPARPAWRVIFQISMLLLMVDPDMDKAMEAGMSSRKNVVMAIIIVAGSDLGMKPNIIVPGGVKKCDKAESLGLQSKFE